jgi:hypothetical protein
METKKPTEVGLCKDYRFTLLQVGVVKLAVLLVLLILQLVSILGHKEYFQVQS